LGATQTTWCQRLGIGTTIFVTWGALDFILQVENGTLADGSNHDWPGLIHAGITEHHETKYDEEENTDPFETFTVRFVKVEHLLCTYIFLKCVKGIFLVSI